MRILYFSVAALIAATLACKERDRGVIDETPSNPKIEELEAIAQSDPIIAERPTAKARFDAIEHKLDDLEGTLEADPASNSEHGDALSELENEVERVRSRLGEAQEPERERELDAALGAIEERLRALEEDVGA